MITAVWPPGNCNRFLSRSPSLVAVAWPRCMCNWVVLFVGFFECFPLFSYVSYVSYVLWCLTVCSVCSVLLSLLWFSSVLFLGGLVCIGFGWFRLIWSFLFLGYLVWVWRRLGIQDHSVMDCKGPFSILMIDSGMELTLSKLLTNGCPSLPYVPSFLSFLCFFLFCTISSFFPLHSNDEICMVMHSAPEKVQLMFNHCSCWLSAQSKQLHINDEDIHPFIRWIMDHAGKYDDLAKWWPGVIKVLIDDESWLTARWFQTCSAFPKFVAWWSHMSSVRFDHDPLLDL